MRKKRRKNKGGRAPDKNIAVDEENPDTKSLKSLLKVPGQSGSKPAKIVRIIEDD